jgi:glycerol kinase
VNWARGLGLFDSFEALNALGGDAAIDQGLAFVPALSGLACPHWDRRARGLWIGLSIDHGRDEMMKSILEGVAFRAAEVIAAMQAQVPSTAPISIDGGMSRNPYFTRFLAEVLDREIRVAGNAELTGSGTAHLAAAASGVAVQENALWQTMRPEQSRSAQRAAFSDAVAIAQGWSS